MAAGPASTAFNATASLDQKLEKASLTGDFQEVKKILDKMSPDDVDSLLPETVGKVLKNIETPGPGRDHEAAANIALVMQKIGRTGSPEAVGDALMQAAQLAGPESLRAVANGMTKDQVANLDPAIAGQVVTSVLALGAPGKEHETADLLDAIMKKIGARADSASIGNAMSPALYNAPALRAIAENLTPDQIDGLDPKAVNSAISNVAAPFPGQENAAGADVDFMMKKIGRQADSAWLGEMIAHNATIGNAPILRAIVNNLTPDQVEGLSPEDVGKAIDALAKGGMPGKEQANAKLVSDVLDKIGKQASPQDLGGVLMGAAAQGNIAIVKTVTAHMTPDQVDGLMPQDVSLAVAALATNVLPGKYNENAAVIAEVMKKAGKMADPAELDKTLTTAAAQGNGPAVKAILDNLTPEQKEAITFKPASESKFTDPAASPPSGTRTRKTAARHAP